MRAIDLGRFRLHVVSDGKFKLDGFKDTDEAMRAIRGRAPGDPYPPPDEDA